MQINLNKLPLAVFVGVLILFFMASAFAKEDPNAPAGPMLAKPNAVQAIAKSLSNIGNWSYPIWATGRSGIAFNGNDPGGIYPRSTAATIYTDGLVWGGYVGQDTLPKVGGVTYRTGVQAGWIVTPGTETSEPVFSNPDDERARMWRIRVDYATLTLEDVRKDAAEMNLVDAEDVTEEQMQDILDQYAYDWEHWPVELGAPYYDVNGNGQYDPGYEEDLNGDGIISIGEREEPGVAKADQIVWVIYNDKPANTLYGSDSIGIELQSTTWAYNQPSATLGQLVFRKYTFINKSGWDIDSMFVCQWCDPDVGVYTDDFVGNDTTRSLGYAYTSAPTDGDYTAYNLPPAAMGYDFFQGPMVPSVGDTAIFGLEKVADHKNLPMTSFFYFASGSNISDPPLGDFDGTLEFYNMLNGYTPTTNLDAPTAYKVGSGANAGEPTLFPLAGDVVTQQGDVDGQGTNLQPGDRRMGMCSGPFTMENGGTQEVVVAIIGGIVAQEGGNNRNAVVQVQLNSDFAQFIYDNLFKAIPRAPAKPDVVLTPQEDHVILEWGSNAEKVAETEADDPLLGFNFEGYNIYQLPTQNSTIDQAFKVATYDVINGITTIYGTKFVGSIGDIITVPIQTGVDTGIKRNFVATLDYINGLPLYAGSTYYWAVTAYNYNSDPNVPEPSLESSAEALIVTMQGTTPGTRYGSGVGDLVDVEHVEGTSDGQVQVEVIDPAATTGHDYEVFFTLDEDTNSSTYGQLVWNVRDTDTGELKVEGMEQMPTLDAYDDLPIFDGIQVKASGPKQDFKHFVVTQNAGGELDPWEMGCFAFNNNGFPFYNDSDRPDGDRQQTNGSTWGINHNTPDEPDYDDFKPQVTGYTGGYGEAVMGLEFLIPRDYEIRFTDTPAPAFYRWPYLDGTEAPNIPAFMGEVPFELWCLGDNLDDPADDYQCLAWINDENEDGEFNLLAVDHEVSGGSNDPYTDGIYWVEPISRDQAGYDALLQAHIDDPAGANAEVLWAYKTAYDPWNCVAGMMRMVIVNWNGGDVTDPTFPANVDAVMPEAGTIFRIGTSKPNLINDKFAWTSPAVTYSDADAQVDVEKMNVYPNPYYAYNSAEPDRFTRFITFNHMPPKATIRIFNLAGTQVVKLEKDSPDQFLKWNLQNQNGIPVASGMYIAYVDMPELGKEKILKVMIIQAQETLKYY